MVIKFLILLQEVVLTDSVINPTLDAIDILIKALQQKKGCGRPSMAIPTSINTLMTELKNGTIGVT